MPSAVISDACAPSMPRYQPAEPVLRSASVHSTVLLGDALGYGSCDSNAAPYAPRGGTSNAGRTSAGIAPALAVLAPGLNCWRRMPTTMSDAAATRNDSSGRAFANAIM